mmetsp:Transcript_21351/g.48094  ORF Transcript_21351/g.48094 Transcript_21351/m.48094 type:complete len:508 (+) Transcript_21351:35-1558(+)
MRFYAVLDEAFANAEPLCQGEEGVKYAKKRIREKFRQAASSLEENADLVNWPVDRVLQRIADSALQRLSSYKWFDQVDWAEVLAAFAAEANPRLGTETQLLPVAVDVVERWNRQQDSRDCWKLDPDLELRALERAAKLSVPGRKKEAPASGKEFLAKKSSAKMASRTPPARDLGYKAVEVQGAPKSDLPESKRGEADAREIDLDLGFLSEADSLGVSLQGLEVESTLVAYRAHKLLMPGDVVTSVNGVRLKSHQEFWREVDRAKPGQLRMCVLPRSAMQSSAGPPMPPPPPKQTSSAEQPKPNPGQKEAGPVQVKDVKTSRARPASSAASMIVLNCEDICSNASKCSAFRSKSSGSGDRTSFPWDAVRCVIAFYEKLGFMPQPVCHQATLARHAPSAELRQKLVQCPVVDDDGRQEGRGSERIFVVNLAKTYDCPFVDNSNYREQSWSGHDLWPWLQKGGLAHKVEYIFDSFGEFLPSREVVPEQSAATTSTVSGRLRIPWSEYGGR